MLFISIEAKRSYPKSVNSYETFRTFVGIRPAQKDLFSGLNFACNAKLETKDNFSRNLQNKTAERALSNRRYYTSKKYWIQSLIKQDLLHNRNPSCFFVSSVRFSGAMSQVPVLPS